MLFLGILFCSGCRKKPLQPFETAYQKAIHAIGAKNYDEAQQRIDEAVSEDRIEMRDSALAEDFLVRGYLFRLTGAYDSVAASYQQAIGLAHALGDKRIEREGKFGLAEFRLDARMYDKAEPEASGAATLAILQSDWRNAFIAFSLDARALHGLTRYDQEERLLDSLVRIDSAWLGQTHVRELFEQRFALYRDWDNGPLLRQAWERWHADAAARHDTISLIDSDLLRGEQMQRAAQPDTANRLFAEALTLLDFTSDPQRQVRVLCDLGNVALQSSRMENAVRYYREALDQLSGRMPGNGRQLLEQMLMLQLLGCEWLDRKNASHDTSRFDLEAENIRMGFQNPGVATADGYAFFLRGRMQDRRNQPAAALKSYLLAIDAFERDAALRDPDNDCSRMISAFLDADGSDWYDAPLALYCSVLAPDSAFALNERRNLNDLSEFFGAVPAVLRGDAAPAMESVQRQLAMRRLARQDLFDQAMNGRDADTMRMKKIAESGYGAAGDTLVIPPALSLPFKWLLAAPQIGSRQAQDALSPNAALVEYIPSAKNLYAIVVRHDTTLLCSASIDRGRLNAMLAEYGRLVVLSDSVAGQMGIRQVESRLTTLSAILGSLFISPIQPVLGGIVKLYVVQTPEIGWLPIHTLSHGTPAAKYIVSYLPTAGALFFPSAPPGPVSAVAGFGYRGNTGWDVEYELKDIRAFYKDARMIFDSTATARHLTDSSYDVLHLCMEFDLNTRAPGQSALIVSDGLPGSRGQAFPFGNFLAMPPSPVVVFSNIAAQPGGLSRYAPAAFLANGTSTFIGTMWQGDRKPKKYFGEVFYTSLPAGMAAPEAYHQAMSKMTGAQEYDSPRFYGSYYCFGK